MYLLASPMPFRRRKLYDTLRRLWTTRTRLLTCEVAVIRLMIGIKWSLFRALVQIRRRFGTFTRNLTSLSEEEQAKLGISGVFENHRREPATRATLESEGEKGQPR